MFVQEEFILECKKVSENFKVVGMKNHGIFANFGSEVPQYAQQFLGRSNEIQIPTETEVALFEPKRDENHLEGHYYVGLIVSETLKEVPAGMEYVEVTHHYLKTRGKITDVGILHKHLNKFADENGYERDLSSYIVETYHPVENGGEEVEIYLPIH